MILLRLRSQAAMQAALPKLLLSKLSRQLCHPPRTSIFGRCVPAAGFSTRSESRRDDGSEEPFLRSLDFNADAREEQQRTHQGTSPDQSSARPSLRSGQQRRKEPPFRGEEGIEGGSGDLFPDFGMSDDELGGMGRGPRVRSHGRSTSRGPRMEDFGRSPQSSKDSDRGNLGSFGTSRHGSPLRSVGRDRGEELENASPDRGRGLENAGDGLSESSRIGDSLAQKLNLGEVGVEETKRRPPTLVESGGEEEPPEDADLIFKKMRETGLIPNAVAMLDGLCKDGLVQEAMKLFGLMREKGTIPEVVIYTAVVEGFCKAAKFDDAKRIFRKMHKNGITPNAFCYKVLIQGLCKGKKLDDAVDACMEMLAAGHSPSAATFISLVDEIIKEKGAEEADSFVKTLLDRGFLLDEKAVREHLDKKGPFKPVLWDVILGKKNSRGPF